MKEKQTLKEFLDLSRGGSRAIDRGAMFCCYHDFHCPFATLADKEYEEISNDPSEAVYHCSLLNRKVWGEHPECTAEDMRLAYDGLESV